MLTRVLHSTYLNTGQSECTVGMWSVASIHLGDWKPKEWSRGGEVIMWVCITKTFECRDHQRHCKESGENFTKCPQLSCFGALLRTVFVNINFYFFSKNMFLIFSLILFLKFYFFQRLAFGFVKNVQLNLKCWYESSVVHRTNLQKWLISAIADSLRHAER